MLCRGFLLVTNVVIESRFGQKHLLNALNVNVALLPEPNQVGVVHKPTQVLLLPKLNRNIFTS